MRPAQRGGRHFRQADRPDLARPHQITQRTHTLLDGHLFVPAVQVVQVDHIGLQAPERGFAGGPQRGGPTVDDAHQLPVASHIHALHAAFAGQREARTVLAQHPTHRGFTGPETIEGGGIEMGDPGIQRRQQQALGLLGGNGWAIGMADVHAAKADGTD